MDRSNSRELKIYEKTTAATRAKQVKTDGNVDPNEKALEHRHNMGWFARPEKFLDDRPNSIESRNRIKGLGSQSGSHRLRSQDTEEYNYQEEKEQVEESGTTSPEPSPYQIPAREKHDSEKYDFTSN